MAPVNGMIFIIGKPDGKRKEKHMAYRRRKTARRATGYSRGRSYATRSARRSPARRRRSVSRRGQTVRIVVQTVGASQAQNKSSVVPMRAMF